MKLTHIICSAAVAATVTLSAHAAEPWSLDSCIHYALEHNISVRSARIDSISATLDITEAKDRFLPQMNADASQTFNFGRGLTSENTYANRNTSQFGWNVGLSVPLFQGLEAKRRLDYSRANMLAVVQRLGAARDNVELNVMAQYLQVLYARELHEVALEQVRLSEVEVERQQALFEAGKIPELDLTQARSQLAQDRLTVVTSDNDRLLALLNLAQLLQLPTTDGFDILPLDASETLMAPMVAEQVYDRAVTSYHAVRAADLAISAADKNISLAKSGYLPRLYFNAGLGSSYYNVNQFDNPPFHRQMRDNFNKALGFTLSIPIFDAFSTRNAVRRAQVQRVNALLQADDARLSLHNAITQAAYQQRAAMAKLVAADTARAAALEALQAMTVKYDYGRATATEYEQAKSTYIKAAAESVQAKYEAILRQRILQFYNR